MEVKCKHCRKDLLDKQSMQLLTSHSDVKDYSMNVGCGFNDAESSSYISVEKMPKWIEHAINQVKFLPKYVITNVMINI